MADRKGKTRPRAYRAAIVVALAAVCAGAAGWWAFRSSAPRGPNLILITIDTLRADHVGAYGATTGATPVLDALARRGVRFDQVQTAVPLTGPSHATIFTGQYPPTHGVRGNVVFTLGSTYPTLATRLKRAGFTTAAFVAAFPVSAALGFNQGFDTFNERLRPVGADGAPERRANDVADASLRWLAARQDDRFFAWLHFYDPHAPYDPPAPYRERFAGRPYDGEIAFADAQIGRVLDALRASGRDQNTIVMVMADHGEGLGDHHELLHGILTYQSTMRVPWIAAGPGVPNDRAVRTRVATIDLVPTALALLGLDADRSLPGHDVGPLMNGRTIASDPLYEESLYGRLNCHWAALRGWIRDDWKLITGVEPELYNLAEDPGEEHNLALAEPDRVRRLTDDLARGLQRLAPGGDRAQRITVSAEQEERLRSLGYASGSGGSGLLDDPSLPDPRTHVELYDRLQTAAAAQGPALARALDEVQEVTKLDPENPFAFSTLAAMAYRHGRLSVAAGAFARALELDPDRPVVRQSYGKLLRELERYAESERELRVAIEQSDDVRMRISLAETLIAEGKHTDAAPLLEAVLAKLPNDSEALGVKGQLLAAQGRLRDALPYFQRAAAGPAPEPLIELARAYLAAGDVAKAREAAEQAVRRRPSEPWAMAIFGHALVRDGQRVTGVASLERAFAAASERPAVWQTLAEGFEAAHDAARAAACRRHAARLRENTIGSKP